MSEDARAFELGDARMRLVDTGLRAPLLLIHGFPLDHQLWAPQVMAFGQERRVLAPDLIGFGGSTAHGRPRVEDHADDLARLLDGLGIRRAVVCGHSMGGYVALAMWRRHADRIAGLVLACTRADADDAAGREGRAALAARLSDAGMAPLVEAMPQRLLAPGASPALLEQAAAMIRRQPTTGSIAALGAMAARPDAGPELSTIDVPCLVITGAEDQLIDPEASRSMAARIPDARLQLVPGAGHLANLEEPGAFNAAMRAFLGRIDAA